MLYIGIIIFSLLFAYIADKKEEKIFLFVIILILSIFCGMRSINMGVDTKNYHTFMLEIKKRGIFYGSDIGFSIISYWLMNFFTNPNYPLMIFSFITNYLVVYRLWDFREKSSFSLMILIYLIIYYPYTFNLVRQFLAISLIFWGTKYLEKLKHKKYIIFNIIASSLHTSSFICLGMLFIKFIKDQKLKNNFTQKMKIFFVIIFLAFIIFILFNKNIIKYLQYFKNITINIHEITLLKISFLLLILFFNKIYKNKSFSKTKYGEIVSMDKYVFELYGIGLSLISIGMLFPFMNRIGFYFMMFEMPFWGQVIRARVNKFIYMVFIIFLLSHTFIVAWMTRNNSDALFIYSTFLSDQNTI